jgi:hypothetical protein
MCRSGRAISAALVALALALVPAVAAAQEPRWRLEQPPPPPGAPFAVPLGTPGDLTFWAPNRGLLAVEGNSVVPRGILSWDGRRWRTLATVCGGPGDTMRIAWAGPTEFWTVSEPSRPRQGSGLTLCRFRGGQVVASYGTADSAPDPYRQMNAAACRAADDCWFGGIGASDPTGARVGAFHLRWDGQSLRTVYAPQGRGVTDIEPVGNGYAETVVVGPRREAPEPPELAQVEADPALLHRIAGSIFSNDPFVPALEADGGSELLALDGAGDNVWAGGGGAASGERAAAAPDGVVARSPLAVAIDADGAREVPLTGTFGPADRIEDIAAVPESDDAWAALVPYADRGRTNVKARVALIDGATGETEVQALPASGSGRGAAARIAFPSPTEGWLVTAGGWLFHYTDGTPLPVDTDPAFATTITFRPNEAAEQLVPDTAPVDDSLLFAPPPVAVEPEQEPPPPRVRRLKPLLRNVKSARKGLSIVVSFRVTRRARVALIARRRGKVVARTRSKVMRPGRRSLSLRLTRRTWPTALAFRTRELTLPGGGGGSDDDVVTSPGDAPDVVSSRVVPGS